MYLYLYLYFILNRTTSRSHRAIYICRHEACGRSYSLKTTLFTVIDRIVKIGDTVWWNRSLISFQNAQVLLLLMGVKVRPPWPQDGRRRGGGGWRQGDHNVNRKDGNITNMKRGGKSIQHFNFSTFFSSGFWGSTCPPSPNRQHWQSESSSSFTTPS